MFRNAISETPLTTEAANDFFSNIRGDIALGEDNTMVATLRALFASRIGPNDSITFSYSSHNSGASRIGRLSVAEMMGLVFSGTDAMRDVISLRNFGSFNPDENDKYIDFIEKHFEENAPGWVRLEKITQYYRKQFKVLVYINPTIRGVQVYAVNLRVSRLHFLQCALLAMFPWYFDGSKEKLTPVEIELVNSLKEPESEKYESCIAQIAAQYDMRTGRIRKLLDGFESKYDRTMLERTRTEIESINANIADLENRIRSYMRQKAEKDVYALGLMTKISNPTGSSDVMDYFLCNRNLSLRAVSDDSMDFVATGYVTYFDEDAAKKFIDNQRSVLYGITAGISQEDMKKLLRAIFVDQTLRMKFCAAYRLNLYGGVEALTGYRYGWECAEFMPNPHTDRYHCMGNHRDAINELLASHDYVGAVEQCISSCKSLNFNDPTVIQCFAKRLYGLDTAANTRCIELPDGKVVGPAEAIEWIKAQEKKQEEKSAQTEEEASHGEAD